MLYPSKMYFKKEVDDLFGVLQLSQKVSMPHPDRAIAMVGALMQLHLLLLLCHRLRQRTSCRPVTSRCCHLDVEVV